MENAVEGLLLACPAPRRRRLAEWAAGVALSVLAGLGPALRMLPTGDRGALACWVAGAVFIPALALLLGVVSGTHRLFQALYLPLWYLAVNGIAAADFMGVVRVAGRPAGPSPWLTAGSAAVTVGLALLVDAYREQPFPVRWRPRAPSAAAT